MDARKRFLDKIKGQLHSLTRGDIDKCVKLWLVDNRGFLMYFSPYRVTRVLYDGMPYSLYQIYQLITSWGKFNKNDPLTDDEAQKIAIILQERAERNSHSNQNHNGNSSTILNALMSCRIISKFLPSRELPHDLVSMCEELQTLLLRHNNIASHDAEIIKSTLKMLIELSNKKDEVAQSVAEGGAYNKNGIIFFISNHNTKKSKLDSPQVRSIIEEFLTKFIYASQICCSRYLMDDYFQCLLESKYNDCLMGKMNFLFRYVDGLRLEDDAASSFEFISQDQLMQHIFTELEIDVVNDISLSLDDVKHKVLSQYRNKRFGQIEITDENVHQYLVKVLMPDLNASMVALR